MFKGTTFEMQGEHLYQKRTLVELTIDINNQDLIILKILLSVPEVILSK